MKGLLRTHSGFSVVELAMIIVVIGLLITVTAPNLNRAFRRAQSDRVSAELQSDLRLALSTAKARGRPVRFLFQGQGYSLIDATDSTTIATRDFGGNVNLTASGNPLVFPWGLVQPTDITMAGSEHTYVYSFLPTGRMEEQP